MSKVKPSNRGKKSLLYLLAAVFFLPFLIIAAKKAVDIKKGAAGSLANIVVDSAKTGSPINPNLWQNFAQGGEEPEDMIGPVVPFVAALEPKLIRIDHIFDAYGVVGPDGQLDFSQLDKTVASIIKTGAKPMFSLSYIPSQYSRDGKITSPPKNWRQWQTLVQKTVEHYSGRDGLGISGVYYEAYNEPDLFGRWHYGRSPNYLKLYYYSSLGAAGAQNTKDFKIGGPATTGLYPNWIKSLLDFALKNNLRLDFISWHQYSLSPDDYAQDFENLNKILTDRPDWLGIERIISEFGPETEKSAWYQTKVGAAHDLAAIVQVMDRVHRIFAFEVKDGPGQSQGWGLLSHQNKGIRPKPRWYAYRFLNNLEGERILLTGQGSWVYGLASKANSKIQIMLVNYDPNQKHYETVPVRVYHLSPGKHRVSYLYLFGKKENKTIDIGESSMLFDQVYLPPNEAVIMEIS